MVRAAILHEPPLYGVLDDPKGVLADVAPLLHEALETGGPPALVERFWRWVAGDSGWDHLHSELRHRMLTTADTFCDIERGTYETHRPDDPRWPRSTRPSPCSPVSTAHHFGCRSLNGWPIDSEFPSSVPPTDTPHTSSIPESWLWPYDPSSSNWTLPHDTLDPVSADNPRPPR